MNARKLLIALLLTMGVVVVSLVVSTSPKKVGARANHSQCIGHWEFTDQYGRTVTWLISGDGTMKRFASDDPAAIQQYQWWTSDGILFIRDPISTIDRAYHGVSFAWQGRALDDGRTELKISASNGNSLRLESNHGPALELTRIEGVE